ncbi:MAG TPA: hypothetical protein VLA96_01190 [Terriglobales bacterium]|jgi:hypothetical protein|nr:hypothetical protein [Terriglobales bacterium]
MKPITEVIRDKENEIQQIRQEVETFARQSEQRIKGIETELETLRAAARIISGDGGQPTAAAAAPIPMPVQTAPAPVETFPVQSVPPAPEPARKRWP